MYSMNYSHWTNNISISHLASALVYQPSQELEGLASLIFYCQNYLGGHVKNDSCFFLCKNWSFILDRDFPTAEETRSQTQVVVWGIMTLKGRRVQCNQPPLPHLCWGRNVSLPQPPQLHTEFNFCDFIFIVLWNFYFSFFHLFLLVRD